MTLFPVMTKAAPLLDGRNTAIELLADQDAVVPGKELKLLIRVRIRDGWHIYWTNPGDSGESLRLTWEALPEGFSINEDMSWPVPKRLPFGPLMNYGYEKEALIWAHFNVPKTTAATEITLKAKTEVLVCEEICIPEYQDISLTLPVAAESKPTNTMFFDRAQKTMIGGTDMVSWFYEEDGKIILWDDHDIMPEAVFPEEWGVIDNPAPQEIKSVTLNGHDYTQVTLKRGTRDITALNPLVFVWRKADGTGMAIAFDRSDPPVTGAASDGNSGWTVVLGALGLALLGGLILNLMPCVFPILSLKALSLVKLSEAERTHAQKSALAYTAGILACFLSFALVLLLLRNTGESIGWGFQLQSPVLVTALAWLMTLVGFNLLGFFDIKGLGGVGDKLTKGTGLTGSFFTGVLAAIVATPCTAPFMATALGVALVQPVPVALLIFVALGVGLALPFLLISFIPYLALHLPRPGLWMERFRQFLAFPMFAASLWLIWVAVSQTGHNGLLFILGGIVLLGFIIWLVRLKGLFAKIWLGLSVILLCVLLAFLPGKESGETAQNYEAFSQQKIDDAPAQNRPVFVNMTAKWCVTCLVNAKVAIETPETLKLFKENNVLYLKGDWTDQDAEITKYLAKYDRQGVPLYVVYKDGKATVLPQLLTSRLVREAIVLPAS